MTGPAFLAIGGIYVLDIVFMGVATAILAALAVWGIEPRKRWREWRNRGVRQVPESIHYPPAK
jgi:hypothetical protein